MLNICCCAWIINLPRNPHGLCSVVCVKIPLECWCYAVVCWSSFVLMFEWKCWSMAAKTLRVLKTQKIWVVWPVHCSIGWEPIGTFHFPLPKRAALISERLITLMPRLTLLWLHLAMHFVHACLKFHPTSQINFSFNFHPKIMQFFPSCSWMCPLFYCEF
jgi:hypothetical protein